MIKLSFPFLIIAVLSCSSPTANTRGNANNLYGQWMLRSIAGGINGNEQKIDTASQKTILTLNENNTATEIHNDSLVWTDKFSIEKRKSIHSLDSINFIIYEKNHSPDAIEHLVKDSLVLGDNMVDGFTRFYTRFR